MSFHYQIVSPEKVVQEGMAEMLVIPGTEGELGLLAKHIPLVTSLQPGVIRVYRQGAIVEKIFIVSGFVSMNQNQCSVLADQAFPVSALKKEDIEQELSAAQHVLEKEESQQRRQELEKQIKVATAKLAAL